MTGKKSAAPKQQPVDAPAETTPVVSSLDDLKEQAAEAVKSKKKGSHG